MCVPDNTQDEVTVLWNGIRYTYKVWNGYQAKKILQKMYPSQGFNWLHKNGELRVTH